MPQCLVIADDLTGADATGVQIKKLNYSSYTVMNIESLDPKMLKESDCILYPTESRSIQPELAYDRVYQAVKQLKGEGVKVYSKRIDSTLRGNLGSETDAFLEALDCGTTDQQTIAMVVPCFPEAKRILVGGYLLVDTVPLHKTAAAVDPKNPVHTSVAQKLYEDQSKYPVASLYINDLMLGKEHLVERILAYKEQGIRTIIFDSVSQDDMDLIADAVIESKVRFITVDPGSFTATVTKKLVVPYSHDNGSRILATVGSVNAVAKTQLDQLLATQKVLNVFAQTKEFIESEARREAEMTRIVDEILNHCSEYEVCSVVGDGIMPENRIDFMPYAEKYQCTPDEVSNMINSSLAEITYRILKSNSDFQGIYTSGGDITVAVTKKFQTAGIKLLDEVVPLAAYGEFISGEFDGLKIITKGGMAGDQYALCTCLNYLKERLHK